jgi:hypothetical protein
VGNPGALTETNKSYPPGNFNDFLDMFPDFNVSIQSAEAA